MAFKLLRNLFFVPKFKLDVLLLQLLNACDKCICNSSAIFLLRAWQTTNRLTDSPIVFMNMSTAFLRVAPVKFATLLHWIDANLSGISSGKDIDPFLWPLPLSARADIDNTT